MGERERERGKGGREGEREGGRGSERGREMGGRERERKGERERIETLLKVCYYYRIC